MEAEESRLEDMVMESFWKHKRVLVTGHTGFKGTWLSLWLQLLGAEVTGYSLALPAVPSLYELSKATDGMVSIEGDIRDFSRLEEVIGSFSPDIVIHMAAQSLVQTGYQEPLETFSTNIMGTVHLLEAVRQTGRPCIVINVTSDKCYENRNQDLAFVETDAMGGFDPYSSSKGCSELITASYRNSFFGSRGSDASDILLASVRAGNVIGGGDWAANRLIPDIMRSFLGRQELGIRYPYAVRPWQHVLEPLGGYLTLAEKLYLDGADYAEAWNFGPDAGEDRPVSWIVEHITGLWGETPRITMADTAPFHEAAYLRLDSSKAKARLGWAPRLPLEEALKWTVAWYKAYGEKPSSLPELTRAQIMEYCRMPQ